jgi:hypothetical protein
LRRQDKLGTRGHTSEVDADAFRASIERLIREQELIPPGGEVVCLVSGGADSTCLLHVLRTLGYKASALHVDHGLRGAESDEDARFCRDVLGAEVVDGRGGTSEDELRRIRYAFATDRLRASGHTASDQVETVLYRLVSSGAPGGIKLHREDGVVRPLLRVWREETCAYCRAERLPYREDTSNPATKRGLVRDEILPLLERLHPAARENLLRAAERRTMPPELAELLGSTAGSKRLDLGGGLVAVREYATVRLEPGGSSPSCQGLRYARGGRATASPAARGRSRTCSSTRRSHAASASRGRSSSGATRSSRCRGSSTRRA